MNVVDKYVRRARFWAQVLRWCPGVRAIFLSGSLAAGKANKDSDIDFFIVVRSGRIWTARFFVFFVLKVFCRLANERNHAGMICPNHFVSDDALLISERDEYAAQLFSHNFPLYDSGGVWSSFVEQNHSWVSDFGFKFMHVSLDDGKVVKFKGQDSGFIERIFRGLQIQKIKQNPDFFLPDAKIILLDTELRFHPKPKNCRY